MGKSSPTKIQAKHVPAGMILEAIQKLEGMPQIYWRGNRLIANNIDRVTIYEVSRHFNEIPHKVLQRKIEKLIDKGILEGCACGCSSSLTANQFPLYEVVRYFVDGEWEDRILPINRPKPSLALGKFVSLTSNVSIEQLLNNIRPTDERLINMTNAEWAAYVREAEE